MKKKFSKNKFTGAALGLALFLNISVTPAFASGTTDFRLEILPISQVAQAEIVVLQENTEQSQNFLKKIGSNFRLNGQKLLAGFRNLF